MKDIVQIQIDQLNSEYINRRHLDIEAMLQYNHMKNNIRNGIDKYIICGKIDLLILLLKK